jgi:tubulin-specific chaperone A
MLKEVAYYEQEVIENEVKLQEVKNDPMKDEYDAKRFEQVLGESRMMIPDSKKRLQVVLNDLSDFFTEQQSYLNKDSEWFDQAAKIILMNTTNDEDRNKRQPIVQQTDISELKADDVF